MLSHQAHREGLLPHRRALPLTARSCESLQALPMQDRPDPRGSVAHAVRRDHARPANRNAMRSFVIGTGAPTLEKLTAAARRRVRVDEPTKVYEYA
jgi:hypothetical protein